MPAEQPIREMLALRADEGYRAFQAKLVPTVDPERILGVRVPELRRLARELRRDRPDDVTAFLQALPHETYDENMLHAILLNGIVGFDACVSALDVFLPHVDNWAVCDTLAPNVFKSRPSELLTYVAQWMASAHPFTVRFGIGMLMRFYLDEAFDPSYLRAVAAVRSDEYYVRMMVAWYVATALAKQWKATIPLVEGCQLESWTHNKAIQKAIESRRITPEQKTYLRTLRV